MFYAERIVVECRKYDINPVLFTSLIWVESKFNHKATSSKGARGLCQIMPAWVKRNNRQLKRAGIPTDGNITVPDLYIPEINIRLGVAILAYYITYRDGHIDRGLATYNGSCRTLGMCRAWYPGLVRSAETKLRNNGYYIGGVDERK
jgi:soluble lytic murein transglycosylase